MQKLITQLYILMEVLIWIKQCPVLKDNHTDVFSLPIGFFLYCKHMLVSEYSPFTPQTSVWQVGAVAVLAFACAPSAAGFGGGRGELAMLGECPV